MHPPRRGVEVGLHTEDLKEEQQGEGVQIHLVNPAVNDEVAQDAEKDQSVYADGREGERYEGKAGKSSIREPAGGDQHKPPMELWPPAPVDGKRKGDSEGDEVHQLDDEEGRRKLSVLLEEEAIHAGGGDLADD